VYHHAGSVFVGANDWKIEPGSLASTFRTKIEIKIFDETLLRMSLYEKKCV
jgi:hypothetical protein